MSIDCYRCLTVLLKILVLYGSLRCGDAIVLKDRYTIGIESYELTVPRKVSEDGLFVSHYLPHFYRTRGRKKRDLGGETVSYIIPLNGTDIQVQLWPSSEMLAPGLVAERHSPGPGNRSKISIRKIRETQCHYRGVVVGMPHSRVALSTCYGLAGHVVMPDDEFLIEPSLLENTQDEYHRHYVYKRQDIHRSGKASNCGVNGRTKDAMKERLEWEKKYGKRIEETSKSNFIFDALKAQQTPKRREKRTRLGTVTEASTKACPIQREWCNMLRKPMFLEIMLTIDASLDKCFFYDIETYIMTIMNIVSGHFFDASIVEPIHVKLVRLVYLAHTLPRLDISRFAPETLLHNFCDWQMEMNPILESHPNHFDIAIFITRFEPCQGRVFGLSHMASICRLDKSCVVVSEEGLLLANIITHQIGHSFGAEHDDGDIGGCFGEDLDGVRYHMNPLISMSSTAWSVCSKQSIGTFVKSRMSWCLADVPKDHEYHNPNILPGQVYDAIQQCSMNYKMKTLPCGSGDFCKTLFCQISPNKCATTGDPPAPGTPCAEDMWCFNGDCVHRGQRPGAMDGDWGSWTAWTPCTRTCGGGVQTRFRQCDSPPPKNGGRHCMGAWVTHRMCSITPCPGYSPTFLDIQCKMTNKRPYRGHYYLWDHFRTFFEDIRCALVCINERNEVSVRAPLVIDGSPCRPGTNNVCIGGECRRVGCDWVIESSARYDMCGNCHGPGTGCKVVQGCFMDPGIYGYVPFLKLPERTGMIYIRELDSSPCHLAISTHNNQTFYLNGPDVSDHLPGEFNVAGVTGVYDSRDNLERVFIRSPIKSGISISCNTGLTEVGRHGLQAVCAEKDTLGGFRYQYSLPEERPCYMPTYRWEYLYWDDCSQMCGSGIQRARPSCVEIHGGEVEDKYCSLLNKPHDIARPCNIKSCTAKWWVGSWSDCDCTDGEGIMTRLVFCMKSFKSDHSMAKIVKDKECNYQPKPRVQRPCNPEKDSRLFAAGKIKRSVPDYYSDELYDEEDDDDLPSDNEDPLSLEPPEKQHIISPGTRGEAADRVVVTKKIRNRYHSPKAKKLSLANPPLEMDDETNENEPPEGNFSEKDEEPVNISNDEQNSKKKKGKKILIQVVDSEMKNNEMLNSLKKDHLPNMKESKPVGGGQRESSCDSCAPDCSAEVCTQPLTCRKTDYFLDQIFPLHKTTTCSPSEDREELADRGPRFEFTNSSLYKMIIIPVAGVPSVMAKTDIGLMTFGDSLYFPPGLALNQTHITGETIFKILQEARRRATRPPIIDLADD